MPRFYITISRKFEPSELCEVFVGRWLKVLYLLTLTVYSFFATLSYATVAGSAWSVNLPLNFGTLKECSDKDFFNQIIPDDEGCANAYRFCVFLFGVIVIPITLLDLKEQAIVQLILGLLRFLTLGCIIIYCLVYLFQGDVIANCGNPFTNYTPFDNETIINETDLFNATSSLKDIVLHFNFNSWVAAIPVFVYAFILHQGIPSLTHPIKEKNWLRSYFNLLFFVITLFYLTLGLVVGFWFRDCTNETCTLNWHPFTSPSHSTALRVLSYYLILFPSIDVCSVFPLLIHTIVNNIYTVVFCHDSSEMKGWSYFFIHLGMKFVAAIVPIAIGLCVSNLVYVLKYAGLLGFFISLFYPILWQLSSQWVCYRTFKYEIQSDSSSDSIYSQEDAFPAQIQDETKVLLRKKNHKPSIARSLYDFILTRRCVPYYKTPYSSPMSHPLVVVLFLGIALICFVLTIVSLFV
jgi:hypothetical protein